MNLNPSASVANEPREKGCLQRGLRGKVAGFDSRGGFHGSENGPGQLKPQGLVMRQPPGEGATPMQRFRVEFASRMKRQGFGSKVPVRP